MKIRTLLGVICAPLVFAGALKAQFTVTYSFGSVTTTSGTTDPTAVPTSTGVTFGSFTAAGTPANPNATGRFSFIDWATGSANNNNIYSALTGSVNTAEYFSVTITPQAGYELDLTSLAFTTQRSGTGIRTFAVRSDAGSDAFSTNLTASSSNAGISVQSGNIFYWTTDATTTALTGSSINLSGASFQNLTSSVTFRFYGWNAEANTGSFSIDDVSFTGTASVSAIPEPSTYAAIFGGLALVGAVVHRRRKATRA